MIDYPNYDKTVLISSDGDFYSLTRYLYDNKKLLAVLSPHRKTCSSLLRKSAKDKMVYMDNLRDKLAKRKSTAQGRNPYEVLFHMDVCSITPAGQKSIVIHILIYIYMINPQGRIFCFPAREE